MDKMHLFIMSVIQSWRGNFEVPRRRWFCISLSFYHVRI